MIYGIIGGPKLARHRERLPLGCLNYCICGGSIWLDARGGGPRAVIIIVFLVVQIWLDPEGVGPRAV